MLKALIFDVDGTLADTESAHCAAFNQAFAQFGLGWHWDDTLYIELLKVTGGRERILHYIKTARPELSAFATLGFEASLKRLFELKPEAYVRSVHAGAVETAMMRHLHPGAFPRGCPRRAGVRHLGTRTPHGGDPGRRQDHVLASDGECRRLAAPG